jgi:hypothetical protein
MKESEGQTGHVRTPVFEGPLYSQTGMKLHILHTNIKDLTLPDAYRDHAELRWTAPGDAA